MPMNDNTPARRDAFDGIEYGDVVGVAADLRGEPRPAEGRQEVWASRGLVTLTGACDGAVTDDGIGFNKSDTNGGRYLGYHIGAGRALDDVEWEAAITMLGKYHGQIGSKPAPDEHDLARRDRVMQVDEDEGFRARLDVVLDEARSLQKERMAAAAELQRRIDNPDVIIGREGADRPDGGVLTVKTTRRVGYDVFEARRAAWSALHAEHGGRWDGVGALRTVPYRAARALNALLEAHHDGEVCRGTTGKVYLIKHNVVLDDPNAPVDEDEDEDEADDEVVAPPAPVVKAKPAPAPVVVAHGDGGEYASLVAAIRSAPNEQKALQLAYPKAFQLTMALDMGVAGNAMTKAQAIVRALRG
jgi:hypothetical protein